MKKAIMGGEMICPPVQTDKVPGLFCAWGPGMVPRLQITRQGEIEISRLLPPDETYLGKFENPLGWTEQILEDPEFQSPNTCLATQIGEMSNAERQIFEAGVLPERGGKILLPHENITASGCGPWYLKPARLQKLAGCSEVEAQDLADICKVLEATETMAREFCRWASVRGATACIEYFQTYVDLTNEEPKLDGLDNLNLTAIEGWEFSLSEAGDRVGTDGISNDITCYPDPRFKWNWEPPVHESEGGAPATDWHVARQYEFDGTEIQEVPDPQDLKPDWISLQPEEFQLLLIDIRACERAEVLDAITRHIQKSKEWTVVQGRVLHSHIRAARNRFEKPSALAQGVIKRIQGCPKEKLGSLAKGIFNLIRDGKLKVSKIDQRLIWKAYRSAKLA